MAIETKIVLTGDDAPLRRALNSAREGLNRFGNEALEPFAKIRDSLGNLGNIMAGIGAVKLIGLADQAALIQARLKDVTGSIQAGQQAQGQLFAASQRLQVSYSDMAGSFSKMLPAVKEMGGGASEAVRLAETLAISARLSGASSAEASASAQQFAQALQSGVLQSDELKSILENNGALSRMLATGLGTSVDRLKDLGEQGKLTSDKVAKALLGQYDEIQARSAELPATVGGAWQQVTNSFQMFTAAANEGTGIFAGVSAVLSGLSRFIDAVRVVLGDTGKEADKLNKNNGIKAWGEAVGAIFAYVVDIGRGVYTMIELVGKQIGALAAAAVAAAKGQFGEARTIMSEYAKDFQESWQRIQTLMSGGSGSTLQAFALNTGQDAPSTSSSSKLKSTAPKGKDKKGGEDKSFMGAMEAALEAQKAYLAEQQILLNQSKQFELKYWQDILDASGRAEREKLDGFRLSEGDKISILKKTSELRIAIAKAEAKEQLDLEAESVDAWQKIELLKVDSQEIALRAMVDQDKISKAKALDREIEFEEMRLKIKLEYLRRQQDLKPDDDLGGRAKLSNDASIAIQQSDNKKSELKARKEKASADEPFDFNGLFEKMGDSAASGFGKILTNARNFRSQLVGIYNSIRDTFIRVVVTEQVQAQLAAWSRMLIAKLGFAAQEKAVDAAGSAATVAVKGAETTAVTSMNAVQAATGAAASQSPIPVIGPYLAIAAMGAIFAAVSAMGGKVKSARNGYDIPAGVNPVTQLHEEEMVLPKDIANPLRESLGQGGAGGGQVIYNDHSGRLSDSDIRRKAGVIATELNRLHRNGWRAN